jgi:lysophospholipase L1-like esterase
MSRIRRAAAIAVYVAFIAALVEGSLQAFYYATAGDILFRRVGRAMYVPDPDSGFWNRPNLAMPHQTNEFRTMLYTNAQGFRTSAAHEEYAVPKPPGTYRVLLLGPSFAFGWGVDHEQGIGEQLRARLEAADFGRGRRVELVNAGVPSLDPLAQLRWLRARGRALEPDLIVQLVYGSMDVAPNEGIEVDASGYLVQPGSTSGQWREFVKQSATVFYGWIVATRVRALFGEEPAAGEIQGAGRKLTEQTAFDAASPALARSLGFYRDLERTASEIDAQLLIVTFPLSYVVHPEDAARWRHLGVRNIEAQRAFDAAYCAHLEAGGGPCLDISDALIEATRTSGERLYYWLDIHWTPAGYRVAAEAVARRLVNEGPGRRR